MKDALKSLNFSLGSGSDCDKEKWKVGMVSIISRVKKPVQQLAQQCALSLFRGAYLASLLHPQFHISEWFF